MKPATDRATAQQLFQREPPPGYREQWAAHYAAPVQDVAATATSVVVFRLGSEWLALPTGVFREIVSWRAIHSLPHRRSALVLGLANIRGELLVCLSLAGLLGIEMDKQPPATRRLLVLAHAGSPAVLPADEVPGTVKFRPTQLRDVPATVARATATYTRAVLPWQERTVGLLDEQLLFETLNRSFA